MESNLPPPDDEYIMAAADAVLAGTLALLTGHAQCACAQQRMMMARKIRSNLYLLAQHPSLADAALLPLLRQFAGVEPLWFAEAPYPQLRDWLQGWLASDLFKAVMAR